MESLSRYELENTPRITREDIKEGGVYRLLTSYSGHDAGDLIKINRAGSSRIVKGTNILKDRKYSGYWFRLGPL